MPESAGLGCGVFMRIFRVAIIRYGSGHAGTIRTGGYGYIATGGGAPCARIGPTLHASPDAVAIFLLELYFDGAVCASVLGTDHTCNMRGTATDRQTCRDTGG